MNEVNGWLLSTFNALFADQHFLPYIGILANLRPAICKPPADKNGTVWSFIYLMHLSCPANRNVVDVAFKSHFSFTVSRIFSICRSFYLLTITHEMAG